MNKKNFLIIIFLLFFSILLFSGSYGTISKSPDKQIADIYIKNSIEQFEKDNYDDAFSLSNIALSFNSESSDAKLINAVSGRKTGLSNNEINELSDSLILDKWNNYNEVVARFYLSKYMYWNGNIDEAYLNLTPFRNKLLENSKFADFFIRISLEVGKKDAAIMTAEDLLKIDPYDKYAQLTLAMYSSSWLEKSVEILSQGDPSNLISKKVVQFLIKSSSDCTYFRNYYLNKWGADRFYNISNLCKQKDKLVNNLTTLYPDNSIIDSSELLWMYSLFDDIKDKQTIISRFNKINITVLYDTNKDGFNDTKALFQNGKIVSFTFDGNNDNTEDFFVVINDLPESLKVKSDKQVVTYYYNKYPVLASVVISNKVSVTKYQLIPYKLDMDIVHLPSNLMDGIPSIIQNAVFPENDLLTGSSTVKNVTNKKNNIITNYKIVNLDESVERVINSEGIKIVEKHYKNSVLITAYKDLDNDGVFDTVFKYSNGILQSISFDENNNGIAEYVQNYEDGLVSTWDFNEDGLIDSRERTIDGTLFREMSSKFDGVLDTKINIDSGTP